MLHRFDDTGEVKSFRETREGFLDVEITFSKVGALEYLRADGKVETEYLTEEQLFNETSLSSATGKPITYLHPPGGMINKQNVRHYARGCTGTRIIKDSPFAVITATVHDAELIDIIKSGKAKQVSAGYNVEVVKKADGKLYQENRVYNHVAIVPQGRAGDSVRVHYGDSSPSATSDNLSGVGLREPHIANTFHDRAALRYQRPLALSKESSGLNKSQGIPRPTKLPGSIGPADHLKRKQP